LVTPGGDHLVEGLLVPGLHRFLDLRVLDDQEPPLLRIAAVRRAAAGAQDLRDQFIGYRIRLQPPHGAGRLDNLEQVGH
jgi:hypothetical protein